MGKRKLLKESQNKTSKELAKERLEIRRLQFKAEKLGFKNSDNKEELLSAYAGYREEKSAKKAGFIDKDGKGDKTAYRKYLRAGAAKKAGLIDKEGNGDIKAYDKYLRKQTAKNAGFIDKDGEADIKTYNKYTRKQAAKKAGFIGKDGDVDLKNYNKYILEQTAKNVGFIYNGKGDINAYKKHLREQKIKKIENDNCLNINYLDMEEESYLILAGMSQEFSSKII
ncbi:hypothetical protein A3306_03565 [Rickettsia bellii]|uniref:Uncharacterized protein n=1 Tax=Rickettsia bellii str. RML An4 TaxID=1359193 RepID=A0A0F3QC99_RICBE|nr:hypothetical protein [Rickettsia bellii]ARD86288.1 hypothetical protein A3306_03565 [Rickettsia bellii]KJV90163.1 hypothetical protein RBEAN4_1165 [Rickettsia bellii str. RML An4]